MLRDLLRFLLQRAWGARRVAQPPAATAPPAAGPTLGELRGAYALAPDSPAALRALFDALLESDNVGKARAVAAEAAERAPKAYAPRLLLGRAHQKLHEPERALECYAQALRLVGDDPELYDMRGSTYQELGRMDEAFADYERALAMRPGFRLAAFHRGLARLLVRDFARGWDDYELRLEGPARSVRPRWDGSALEGRTLLVRREQGLGDEIMFASIFPELIASARRCFIECDPRLRPLFERSFPDATVFAAIPGDALPARIARERIDFEVFAGSLAALRRRREADFPAHAGYLSADAASIARWRERLAALGPGLKVGIAWTGGVRKTRRPVRSLAPQQLLEVLRVPGARFVSLEYAGGAAAEVAALENRHGVRLAHWPEAIADYDQTAALVAALDLVVCVCTAVAHLGGALGRPVWVMAPFSPEWRYGIAGDAMPWYPSVRIFRQPAYGEWAPVTRAVAAALAAPPE